MGFKIKTDGTNLIPDYLPSVFQEESKKEEDDGDEHVVNSVCVGGDSRMLSMERNKSTGNRTEGQWGSFNGAVRSKRRDMYSIDEEENF